MLKKHYKFLSIILLVAFVNIIGVIKIANKYCNLDGSKKIKHEYENINVGFGRVEADVRSIITGQDLDPNKDIEVLAARGGNPTLGDRFNKIEVDKSDKIYVDTQISNLNTQISNIGDASPKGAFPTLAALQSAFPNGADGVYVVTADGKWYYWNGSVWVAGGTYQSTGIADNSIEPSKTTFIKRTKNLFNKQTIIDSYYVNETNGMLAANAGYLSTDWIEIKPSTNYKMSRPPQRYAFYDESKTFISGDIGNSATILYSPSNAKYFRTCGQKAIWNNLDIIQLEEGDTTTTYTPYYLMDEDYIKTPNIGYPVNGDNNKQYRMIGANIRTPITVGDTFKLHNDEGHEPMGISGVSIVDGDLRVAMNFTAKKVITMNANPHVSMRNVGYEVATTGGLSVHAVSFYKDGVKVNAEDVIINGGSFWISGMFLIE